MTRDTWHMTCDTWQVTCERRWTFSQNFKSLAHTVWEWRCFEDIWTKGSPTLLISSEGVCRTAPATLGLLKNMGFIFPVLSRRAKVWSSGQVWWIPGGSELGHFLPPYNGGNLAEILHCHGLKTKCQGKTRSFGLWSNLIRIVVRISVKDKHIRGHVS